MDSVGFPTAVRASWDDGKKTVVFLRDILREACQCFSEPRRIPYNSERQEANLIIPSTPEPLEMADNQGIEQETQGHVVFINCYLLSYISSMVI